ncbi:hypothetical protein ACLF3M_00005, partial [Falsiroseomonas sp. HW251]
MRDGTRRGIAFAASVLLHAAVLAAMLWAAARVPPEPAPQGTVALIWDSERDGASDAEDSAAMPGGPAAPPSVPSVPVEDSPAPPAAEIAPPVPPAPEAPT